jgi:DNA-binding NarL/FixJ family response regulator
VPSLQVKTGGELVAMRNAPDPAPGVVEPGTIPSQVHADELRIATAASDRLRLQLLVHYVHRIQGCRCVASTSDLDALEVTATIAGAELVVLCGHGLSAPRLSALVAQLVRDPARPVVVIGSAGESEPAAAALAAGATGYLTDDSDLDTFDRVLRRVAEGDVDVDTATVSSMVRAFVRGCPAPRRPEQLYRLTPRERDVLRLLADGASTYVVSERLSMSPHTARSHIKSILAKLDVHTRLEAAAMAVDRGLL